MMNKANNLSNDINSDSSEKNMNTEINMYDSEDEKIHNLAIFVNEALDETIFFDPSNQEEVDAVLDRYNYAKGILENINFKTIYEIEIHGEIFNYENQKEGILIFHPKWSLLGYGENMFQAQKDLIDNMKIIADDYIGEPYSNLTKDARDLKDYLISILY